MSEDRDAAMAEFRELSARVAAQQATDAELQRWRELRNWLAGPPVPPRRTPPATPRAHARVTRKVRVVWQPLATMRVGFSEEVSAGGLRLRVPELLEIGATLLVRLELDGPGDPEPVTAVARVAWCQREGGHYAAGLELMGLAPRERERLEAHAHIVAGGAPGGGLPSGDDPAGELLPEELLTEELPTEELPTEELPTDDEPTIA